MTATSSSNFNHSAKRTIDMEAQAVAALGERIGEDFDAACQLLLECKGRVIVTGMGKSGHIARKIAATLASTGTPSHFVHPGEASHGDMGMITVGDAVIALSNSGEVSEVVTLLPLLKRIGSRLIAMTGNPNSICRPTDRWYLPHHCRKASRWSLLTNISNRLILMIRLIWWVYP